MKIFAVNPGSTSTKIALFENENCLFSRNVSHDAAKLAEFPGISEQLPYRMQTIQSLMEESHVSLEDVDAFVGRGGGLLAMEGGTYEVDPVMLDHSWRGANGVQHPAQLGPHIAKHLADRYGAKAYVVNPPDVDELQDVARMTGIDGVYRIIHLHALNLKETAIRHAKTVLGRRYEDCSLIVCHIGGGVSVSAHRGGRMIDGYDIVGGEGPMAPTRCGGISVANVLDYLETHSVQEVRSMLTKTGGFVSQVGYSDAIQLTKQAAAGDRKAEMVWNAIIYQIAKGIGAMASVLHGQVDGVLLGGGMVYSEDLVRQLKDYCGYIAPVTAYPGEFEMEAMAAGALRVLTGEETARRYTGKLVWSGFDWDKV